MNTSERGLSIIKKFEGFRADAYRCPAGIWTIGYGHTKGVKPGDKVTREEAEKLLREDVKIYEDGVRTYVKVPLNQNEFDALVSFCYNVGVVAFSKSSPVRFVNAGQRDKVGMGLGLWIKGGGKVLPGLVSRRALETDLFYKKPVEETVVIPKLPDPVIPAPVVTDTMIIPAPKKVGFWSWLKQKFFA